MSKNAVFHAELRSHAHRRHPQGLKRILACGFVDIVLQNKSFYSTLLKMEHLFCISFNLDKFLTLMKVKKVSLSLRLIEILHYLCTLQSGRDTFLRRA